MSTAIVTYNGDLTTNAIHVKSSAKIATDAPVDNHGKGEGFSPTDLLATSLAACMLTVMGIKAKSSSIDIAGTEASVEKIMASNPRRVDRLKVQIRFPNDKYTDQEKKVLEHTALNCPVAKSLSEQLSQEVTFEYTLATKID